MNREWVDELIRRISEFLGVGDEGPEPLKRLSSMDPFKLLVATILSQNTNDKNSIRAFRRLEEKVGITPESILKADERDIEDAIRVGGLYKQKTIALKKIARVVIEKYAGNLTSLIQKPLDEARRELMKLPKVGYKTADVVLLFAGKKSVFPVDTHITRISKRLGLVEDRATYEEIRASWEKLLDKEKFGFVHLLLIEFGRRVCTAKSPRCKECPVNDLCKAYLGGAAKA